jgi:hypothetical protein
VKALVALLAVVLVGVLPGVVPIASPAAAKGARSSPALYYETETSARNLAIERLSLDGSRTIREVVDVGNVNVFGIALGGRHVYWSFQAGLHSRGAIMRASLSGGGVRTIVGGLDAPASVVAAHGFVYWVDQHAIGRVGFDGSHLNRRFIVLPQELHGGVADGLATDGAHLFFSRCVEHAIGRADLDGSHLSAAFLSLGAAGCPQGLAVGPGHIYWTELGAGRIGRARLDGRGANDSWLDVRTNQGPFQVVADATHVYWTWGGVAGSPAWTGRAAADGSGLDRRFLFRSLYPMALEP